MTKNTASLMNNDHVAQIEGDGFLSPHGTARSVPHRDADVRKYADVKADADIRGDSDAKISIDAKAAADVQADTDLQADTDVQADTKKQANNTQKTGFQEFMAEWFPYIIFFIVVLLFRITILINAVIPSESMVATIQKGDHVIGLKSTYWFSEPQRGDIVVFHAPDTPETLYIKRVIGTPGDTVLISDGKTYINGTLLEEDYLPEPMYGDFGPYVVPEDSWFMLGDNRNHSLDARYWEHTWVTKDMMVGKAYFQYWPSIKWLY